MVLFVLFKSFNWFNEPLLEDRTDVDEEIPDDLEAVNELVVDANDDILLNSNCWLVKSLWLNDVELFVEPTVVIGADDVVWFG